jgi:hypothetical protein
MPSDEELRSLYQFELVQELYPAFEFRHRDLQLAQIAADSSKDKSILESEYLSHAFREEDLNRQLMGFVWRRKFISSDVEEAIVEGFSSELSATDRADVLDVSKERKKSKRDEGGVTKVVSIRNGKVVTKRDDGDEL